MGLLNVKLYVVRLMYRSLESCLCRWTPDLTSVYADGHLSCLPICINRNGRSLFTLPWRIRSVYGPVAKLDHTYWSNPLPLLWCGSLKRGLPAQVSSSVRGSK
ncbi:hypothetical protein AVEN_242391-1 [Araneus ventricosus]|uniref:Uncharacterized protein n=1 Tax=Araneus ventricosus TaxID=182803 RepID=A0A4Y2VYL8_ARAVE|nr:hypothetical protein AVEN_190482-1 [Araneus ventricosus]GBO29365.1 hypothetical protein AVEN_242391-1 [Araneus ventricosus]